MHEISIARLAVITMDMGSGMIVGHIDHSTKQIIQSKQSDGSIGFCTFLQGVAEAGFCKKDVNPFFSGNAMTAVYKFLEDFNANCFIAVFAFSI